tara:strand:- start:31821 stop:33476 length:1656 start_codon:yes stop_codon:yes gene_type:complete
MELELEKVEGEEETSVIDEGFQSELDRRKKLQEDWLNEPEQRETLLKRAQYNQVAGKDKAAQMLLWNLCKRDDAPAEGCIFFIETFCWTYDPRSKDKNLPVVLYDFQKDAIRYLVEHIDHGKDFLIEKSRDMGATWLVVYVFIWYWLFREGTNLLMGSYKEKLVDDGANQDAIFGKIEYALRNMPKWILPRRFNLSKHRTKLKLLNPENNNIISGDTMNSEFGRGARKTAIFYDELGFWDTAKESWDAGGDTSPCRIANSTPKGRNFYWKLRTSGMDVISLLWKLHPLKDKQWYEFEKSRRTPETIAQEIDLSYDRSLEGRVYTEWQPEVGHFAYNSSYPLYVGADWGKSDGTAIIWAQVIDNRLRVVDSFYKTGETIDFFIPFFTGMIPSDDYRYNSKELEKIESHRGWRKGMVFGDPAGRFTSAVTNKSVISILRDAGIYVNYEERWKEFQTRKTAVKQRIRQGVDVHKNSDNEYFSMCIEQASYPKVKKLGEEEIRSVKPNHDWTSHHRSALEYLCLGLEDAVGHRVKVRDKFSSNGKSFSPYVRRRR